MTKKEKDQLKAEMDKIEYPLNTQQKFIKPKKTKLQELRAKSPFKTQAQRKGRGRSQGNFGSATINHKLNQERAECRAVEFQLKRTFGI